MPMPLKRTTTSKHLTDLGFLLQNVTMCGELGQAEWVAVYTLLLVGTAQRITLLSLHLRQCPEKLSGSDGEQNRSQDLSANALAAFRQAYLC